MRSCKWVDLVMFEKGRFNAFLVRFGSLTLNLGWSSAAFLELSLKGVRAARNKSPRLATARPLKHLLSLKQAAFQL